MNFHSNTVKILLFNLLFNSFGILGQELKLIKDRKDNTSYYVLKNDKKIKHGAYTSYDTNKKTIVTGFYKNNEPDSVWSTYNANGNLYFTYDYKTKSVEIFEDKPWDGKQKFFLKKTNDSSTVTISRLPLYIGGSLAVSKHIVNNVNIPVSLITSGMKGQTVVQYTITKMGEAKHFSIVQSLEKNFDNEVLRVLELLPERWIPAEANGKPIDIVTEYTFRFSRN
jgi:hypothetical protein